MKKNYLLPILLMFSSISLSSCNNAASSVVEENITLTYELNGGVMPSYFQGKDNKLTIKKGEQLSTNHLPSPTKDNFIFIGWFLSDDVSAGQITTSSTLFKNTTLYARYKTDDSSIIPTYEKNVYLNKPARVDVSLSSSLQDKGVNFIFEDPLSAVIISKTKSSLIYKPVKDGQLTIRVESIANSNRFITIEVNVLKETNLTETIDYLLSKTNYTYTGFSINDKGEEEVLSVLKATDNCISQTDKQGKSIFKSSDNFPRYGIGVTSNNVAYYIDCKTQEDIKDGFNTSPLRVKSDTGILDASTFQGNAINTLNDSGDIYGFKALKKSWFSSVTGEDSTYKIEGNYSKNFNEAMIESALLKLTNPILYQDLYYRYSESSDFPYGHMAVLFDTIIYCVDDTSLFVEIKYDSKYYYGRVSDIGTTQQIYEISNFVDTMKSKAINLPEIEYTGLKLLKESGSYYLGGIRERKVTLNKINQNLEDKTRQFTVKTFFNSYYIMDYFTDEQYQYEKDYSSSDGDISVLNPICHNADGSEKSVIQASINNSYSYLLNLKYGRFNPEGGLIARDATALERQTTPISQNSLTKRFPLVNSSNIFFKTDLIYSFKKQNIDSTERYVSYSDEVFNQYNIFNNDDDPTFESKSALRRVTAIKVNLNDSSAVKDYEISLGYMKDGRSVTWFGNYIFSSLGSGYLTQDQNYIMDSSNPKYSYFNLLDSKLRSGNW